MTARDLRAARLAWLLLPLGAAALAHAPALGGGFTNWDDPGYLIFNPLTIDPLAEGALGLLATSDLGYPIPITILAFAAERAAFGLEPLAFHAVSLALHLACVLFAALLARRADVSWPAAAAAAAIFAVHPVGVEPVAWVVGQKDLLAALFLAAAVWVRAGPRGERAGATVSAGLLAAIAIGAKPSAVIAAPVLIALDLARGRCLRRPSSLVLYAALLAVGAASTASGLFGHGFVGGEAPRSFGARTLLEAGWALSLQVGHLFWPEPLLARYFAPEGAALWAGAAAGLSIFAGGLGAAILSYRRGAPEVGLSLAAALLAYLPVSGLVPLTRGPADSYLYLPLLLLSVALARGVDRLLARRPRFPGLAAALLAAGVVAGAWHARGEARDWRDARALWAEVAAAYPEDPRAVVRLGDAHLFAGEPRRAIAIYEQLAREHPAFAPRCIPHGEALLALSRPLEAERLFAEGARLGARQIYRERYAFFLARHPAIEPSDPDAARRALVELAPVLAARGKRPPTVRRAAELLARYGERDLADRLEARLRELERR